MYPDDHQGEAPAEEREIGAMEALWAFFSSMKTAIGLLLVLAVASIAGTIIEDRTGKSIYGDAWYSVLLALIGVNLAVCSVNRFGLVWRRFAHPVVPATAQQVAAMETCATFTIPRQLEAAADSAAKALHSRFFRVAREASGEGICIYAVKGRAGFWGPHVTHVSLLVIFIGAVFGHMFGTTGYTTITENERTSGYYRTNEKVKTPLGFDVALKSFVIKHDDRHNPTGYKSDLEVYDGGNLVDRKVIDVNHPLTHRGLSFYQADYGLSELVVKITAPTGQQLSIPYQIHQEDTAQGRTYSVADNTVTGFTLAGKKMTILVHKLIPDFVGEGQNGSPLPLNPAVEVMLNDRYPEYKGMDAWSRLGWMTAAQSADYKGFKVTIEKIVSYTGLEVSRNPGLPVVYLGFALMILGVILSLYVSHKVVRVLLTPSAQGVGVAMGSTAPQMPGNPDKDLQRLREALTHSG